ncbi:hypothetical protein MKW98_013965 [Papaver atlanticum]|uniref:Uncharacterized protein n=1 Tax=Papaver atlanticum TaxID=357466 RepID=A0AAD4XFC1_9MAGN|nr:hypothetical protein MKW98_013965 [Papaver atlanticum]
MSFLSRKRFCQDNWRGITTRLNNIPHSEELRQYSYDDVLRTTQRSIADGKTLLKMLVHLFGNTVVQYDRYC